MSSSPQQLRRTLTPLLLWGLGVGYVISGMYFGWNLGLKEGGTLGLGLATIGAVILYITFTFSYAELASAIPKAGGAFDYTREALGSDLAFITGMAQIMEFLFAPPAIAFAIGAYFNLQFPQIPVLPVAVFSYLLFTGLNIYGVKAAASFELIVTILAVGELLLFAGVSLPHVKMEHLTQNAFPHGWQGVLAATPFAIWFFLGIEGVANVAEEAINPRRTILLGFSSAIITLVILCALVFIASVGVSGWEAVVFKPDGSTTDSPLPMALGNAVGRDNIFYRLLINVGLFGLLASFHGLILAAGRASFEFGRVRYAPAFLGKIHPRFHTPAAALLVNMAIGLIALWSGQTDAIIVLSVFGALTLYIFSMIALLRLRQVKPGMDRPFKVPAYPLFPLVALGLSIVSFIAISVYNPLLTLLYLLMLGLGLGAFKIFKNKSTWMEVKSSDT
jgi:ethanolamine permease